MKKLIIAALLITGFGQHAYADKMTPRQKQQLISKQLEQCSKLGSFMLIVYDKGKMDGEPRQKYIDMANENIAEYGEENRDLIVPAINYTYDKAYFRSDAKMHADTTLCSNRLDLDINNN